MLITWRPVWEVLCLWLFLQLQRWQVLWFIDPMQWVWSNWHYGNSSIQFSCSVVSDFLWPHGLQHTRLPCLSPNPRACSSSCPSSQWYHPAISSSVVPFSSHLQSFPVSGSFPMSQFFVSGGQKYWSFNFSISPSNEYSGQLVGSSCSPRDSQESSPISQFKSISSLVLSFLYGPTLTSIHDCWKNHSLD